MTDEVHDELEHKYATLAELGVSEVEIERIKAEDVKANDVVPDGGDAHEHEYAKQVDAGTTEDGYARTPVNAELGDGEFVVHGADVAGLNDTLGTQQR